MEPGIISALVALATFLLGLMIIAFKLGHSISRIDRNERDIELNRQEAATSYMELSRKISDGFASVYTRIDALPCRNPKWDGKDRCQ